MSRKVSELSIGGDFKDALTEPGNWTIGLTGFGEMLPYHENKITLNKDAKDKWGLPVLNMDVEIKENEKMRRDMMEDAKSMLEAAGIKHVSSMTAALNQAWVFMKWERPEWAGIRKHLS